MTTIPPPPMTPQAFPLWAVYRPEGDAASPARYELVIGWVPQWDADGETWIYLPVTPMEDGGYGEIRRGKTPDKINFTTTPPPVSSGDQR